MIEIWEPRYRDKTVLIASNKIPATGDTKIAITKGYYKGHYLIDESVVKNCPVEKMQTKRGGEIQVTIVPLDKLRKIEEE